MAQNRIKGTFPKLNGQLVRLIGNNGFQHIKIDSIIVTESGKFELKYNANDFGTAYLSSNDNKPYLVILANEEIELKGDSFAESASISIIKSTENKSFVKYAVEHAKREQALGAWEYLQKIYITDNFIANQKNVSRAINDEINNINKSDLEFINHLPESSNARYYIQLRKLVSSVAKVAQYKTEEIPNTIRLLRNVNYNDSRLNKSGLLTDVIESQFWLLENMGKSLDGVFDEMKISIDFLFSSLYANEKSFNEVTLYLFNYLEKHSLYNASEYLALKALSQDNCTLKDNVLNQFETYRKMKNGNIAPDINFIGDVFQNGVKLSSINKLSNIKTKFKLIVFGSSLCPACQDEMPQIKTFYLKWKSQDTEVIYVSLDTDKNTIINLSKNFPFIIFSDYKKWEMTAVKDFNIFATPTMLLLNKDNKILLRPISTKQLDLWLDYNSNL
jgi:hypothetical protein